MALSRTADLEPDDWQRQVLESRAARLLLNCSRQSGKSTTIATLAVHTALAEPGSLVLLVSPSLRQSGELFRKCARVYVAAGRPIPAIQSSALQLGLANASRIVSLPGKEGTVRGYSGVRLLVIDEAAWVPEDLYVSVRPMLAVSQGRLIVLSTPHGKRGWFYRAWKEGEGWERYEVPASRCPRIAADFLREELTTMGPWRFSQEYDCQFVESASQAFTEAEVHAAFAAGEGIETWDLLTPPPPIRSGAA